MRPPAHAPPQQQFGVGPQAHTLVGAETREEEAVGPSAVQGQESRLGVLPPDSPVWLGFCHCAVHQGTQESLDSLRVG